jgi:hypothetical protein
VGYNSLGEHAWDPAQYVDNGEAEEYDEEPEAVATGEADINGEEQK